MSAARLLRATGRLQGSRAREPHGLLPPWPFAALRNTGVTGLPRNLAILHSPALKPAAVRYWARTMRSPAGELCFAAHARHAEPEMRALGDQGTARLADSPATSHLSQLLQAPPGHATPAAAASADRPDPASPDQER